MRIFTGILLVAFIAASCSQPRGADKSSPAIDGAALKTHIQKLASDDMEGRAPGGKGEELATSYIADFFRSIGLKTQFQAVPMIGITSTVSPMKLTGRAGSQTLKFGDQFMA